MRSRASRPTRRQRSTGPPPDGGPLTPTQGEGPMKRPEIILIDGRSYRWRDLVALRKAQLAAAGKAAALPTLFPLHDDRRPSPARTPAGRYREPSLFDRTD